MPPEILYIPLYACCISIAALWVDTVTRLSVVRATLSRCIAVRADVPKQSVQQPSDAPGATFLVRARAHVRSRGGPIVYAFRLCRFLACAALVALSVCGVMLGGYSKSESTRARGTWPQVAVLVAYTYAMVMSLLAFILPKDSSRTYDGHATFVLLVQFGVFAWRNLYPLTLFGRLPADISVPWLLWSSGVLITLAGVLIPLLIPRLYYPLDPTDPMSKSSAEQTASVLSFLLYSYLDPLIYTAFRMPPLPYDRIPPLPDYDWAKNLAALCLDNIDPLKRRQNGLKDRHVFFGLLRAFAWEHVQIGILVICSSVGRFLGPIAVNRLLVYLETGGRDAVVRPWVWVLLVLCSVLLKSLLMNMYFFISRHVVVQVESIIIQLVFERSLKIRTVNTSSIATPAASTVASPDHHTVDLDSDTPEESNGDATLVGSSTVAETSSVSSSTRSKAKPKPGSQQAAAMDGTIPEQKPVTSEILGRVNTIIGTDLPNVISGRDWLYFIQIPLGIGLSMVYLYEMLGWASFAGMAVMVLGLPFPGMIARLLGKIQTERMEKTEIRVQSVSEATGMLRMAKMFGWEEKVYDQIAEKRRTEIAYVRKKRLLEVLNHVVVFILPILTMMVTFAVYTLILKKELDASRIFPSIVVFDMLRWDLMGAFIWLGGIIQAGVSIGRINDFLSNERLSTKLLDQYDLTGFSPSPPPDEGNVIGFHQATFSWTGFGDWGHPQGQRDFRLHIDDLVFKPNVINLIVGPTGSGKTSILLALLGEMRFYPSGPTSWFGLPRSQGISYAAQEPWVQNETIKKNILLDEPYDEERYRKVVHQCALEPDLSLFEAGDETEVGEKGLTLSGGQKARVTLARAIYSRARIVLLDDVLSALDVHTTRWVVDKCFRGDLVMGRTVLLVTHNVAIAAPVAENVISLGLNGRIAGQGSVAEVLSKDPLFRMEMRDSKATVEKVDEIEVIEEKPAAKKADGKLVLAEEVAEGRLSWRSARFFLDGFGGPIFWLVCVSGYALVHFGSTSATWWLGVWASAYKRSGEEVNVPYYLAVYAMIMGVRTLIYACTYAMYTLASLESCRKIHERLCQSVLRATLRWLDTTPTGRIISRFTQDIKEIDDTLPFELEDLIMHSMSMLMSFAAIIIISPVFAFPGIVLFVVGTIVGQIYIAAQISVKRQLSIWRSPLYSHFTAAAEGVVSIRAYGAEQSFRNELRQRLDGYSRPARVYHNLNSWISIRTDLMGGLFSAGLAAYLLYVNTGAGASNTGFSLNLSVSFCELLLWWVRTILEIEVAGNSLERIYGYVEVEQEPPPTEGGKPPAYWPASGSLQVEHLSARYSKDGPQVLRDLSFDIKSGERVAIVGRTGSGKSSLALSLLRMIPTTGAVYFDHLPTHELNLDALRSNLTIIPQDPILISGSLRSNLDPFSQYDDAILNDALRAAGLFRLQHDDDENRITLDTAVAGGGNNFSVGQRQIIALARAIVRGAKVLILDEATASVDAETDNVIQASIREQLRHSTLITIAHRLQTIADYDKILVLDGGRLVEFDSPIALLEKGGFFCDLVQQSGDREKLWEMARKGRATAFA